MPKGSDLLVAALENEGVERIFGVPGEENLDVVESLRTSKIKLILTRHEQAAAFMAATHGRLTGTPGVCISTLGPGALNLSTGAAYAHLGHDLAGAKTGTNGRHPLPDRNALGRTFSRLGIARDVQVVAYDQDTGMFASRLWWLLRWLGHDAVAVLDGGFAKWIAEGRPAA